MKATVHLVIEVPYEVFDNGYLGDTKSSIAEHIQAAKDEVQRCHVFLKKNTDTEPQLVHATFRVDKVVLTP